MRRELVKRRPKERLPDPASPQCRSSPTAAHQASDPPDRSATSTLRRVVNHARSGHHGGDGHRHTARLGRIRTDPRDDRREQCVLLDGATGTELGTKAGLRPGTEEPLWATRALIDAPADVLAVHRRYVELGCDVISTNTWGLPSAVRQDGPQLWESEHAGALDGHRAARRAARAPGRRRGRARRRGRRRVQRQRRPRHARGRRDDPAARARVRGRAARPDAARDAVARARGDVRDDRAAARRPGCRCGSASAAAARASAASSASTGADPRATPSGARCRASRRSASTRC